MRSVVFTFLLALALLLTPAVATAQVVVNECFTGVPDWCEVINLSSSPVNIGGWSLVMTDDPTTTTVYTFPAGTTLPAFGLAVVSESGTAPAVPAGVQRFTSTININWAGPSSLNDPDGGCGLNNGANAGMDLVLFGSPSNVPAQSPASPFSGSLSTGDVIGRNSMVDTDSSGDWTSAVGGSGTPGAMNPGQSAVPQPPVANFVAAPLFVQIGAPVQFTDTSANGPTSWSWDLDGDGIPDSTAQNPVFSYTANGSYDVTLVVTNSLGTDSLLRSGYITVQVSGAASVPYTQDFNTGPLGSEWSLVSDNSFGRIRLFTDGTASPLSGGDALAMDSNLNGNYATNTATLSLDMSATGGGILKYYARETSDEAHPEDGLFLSDGVNTVLAVDHSTLTSAWLEITVDLTAVAQANGLALNSSFEIIFSQRDNYGIPTDGVFIDDVRVTPPPVPDTGQANQSFASMDVNGGLNLNGHSSALGENGPFFATGNDLLITVDGNPNQPFILLMGPLNRSNAVFPFGNLDIGATGGALNFSDLQVLLDGATGSGFFDQFARTGPTGTASITLGLPGFTPGLLGTLQAVVYTGGPTVLGMTAAFEFTVAP